MDIHNWIMDICNWIMDIHNWIMDINNWIMDIHNWIMDISIIELWISIIEVTNEPKMGKSTKIIKIKETEYEEKRSLCRKKGCIRHNF